MLDGLEPRHDLPGRRLEWADLQHPRTAPHTTVTWTAFMTTFAPMTFCQGTVASPVTSMP